MKKVIFICLLSLSVCLSQPADKPAAPPAQDKPAAPVPEQNAQTETPAVQTTAPPHTDSKQTAVTQPPAAAVTSTKSTMTIPTQSVPAAGNEPKPAVDDNKTTPEKKDPEAHETQTSKNNPEKGTDKPAVAPQPTEADKKVTTTTTPKPEVSPKTTEAPATSGDVKPTLQARGFDGPSFIGGIVLTLGMLAIGFMGFKYYKNQTERNYHTL